MKNMFRYGSIVAFVFFSFTVFFDAAFSQEAKVEGGDLQAYDLQRAFENAMKNVEGDKKKDREKLAEDLRPKLNAAIEKWLAHAKNKWRPEVGQPIKQSWGQDGNFGPYVYHDYYLRDFSYDMKSDLRLMESLTSPYQAFCTVTEKLYAEKDHAPNAPFPRNFLYTATTPIKVQFKYFDGNFVEDTVEYGKTSVEQGWPQEVVTRLKTFE